MMISGEIKRKRCIDLQAKQVKIVRIARIVRTVEILQAVRLLEVIICLNPPILNWKASANQK